MPCAQAQTDKLVLNLVYTGWPSGGALPQHLSVSLASGLACALKLGASASRCRQQPELLTTA